MANPRYSRLKIALRLRLDSRLPTPRLSATRFGSMSKRFYITTAIDYVNGQPHLGHAYEKIIAAGIRRTAFEFDFPPFFGIMSRIAGCH
jgi:hypothetical protein